MGTGDWVGFSGYPQGVHTAVYFAPITAYVERHLYTGLEERRPAIGAVIGPVLRDAGNRARVIHNWGRGRRPRLSSDPIVTGLMEARGASPATARTLSFSTHNLDRSADPVLDGWLSTPGSDRHSLLRSGGRSKRRPFSARAAPPGCFWTRLRPRNRTGVSGLRPASRFCRCHRQRESRGSASSGLDALLPHASTEKRAECVLYRQCLTPVGPVGRTRALSVCAFGLSLRSKPPAGVGRRPQDAIASHDPRSVRCWRLSWRIGFLPGT